MTRNVFNSAMASPKSRKQGRGSSIGYRNMGDGLAQRGIVQRQTHQLQNGEFSISGTVKCSRIDTAQMCVIRLVLYVHETHSTHIT